jgi:hypothetical protein
MVHSQKGGVHCEPLERALAPQAPTTTTNPHNNILNCISQPFALQELDREQATSYHIHP